MNFVECVDFQVKVCEKITPVGLTICEAIAKMGEFPCSGFKESSKKIFKTREGNIRKIVSRLLYLGYIKSDIKYIDHEQKLWYSFNDAGWRKDFSFSFKDFLDSKPKSLSELPPDFVTQIKTSLPYLGRLTDDAIKDIVTSWITESPENTDLEIRKESFKHMTDIEFNKKVFC